MSKFSLVLVVVSVSLIGDVRAMKGGQILEKPLPYTVYILTGDRDDVFYMRDKGQKYKIREGMNSGGNLSALEEYRVGEENNTASLADGGGSNENGGSSTLRSKATLKADADTVPADTGKAGNSMGNKDGNISTEIHVTVAGDFSDNNDAKTLVHDKVNPAGQEKAGRISNDTNIALNPETNAEKSNEEASTAPDLAGDENGKPDTPKVIQIGSDGSNGQPGDLTRSDKQTISSPTSAEVAENRDGPTRDENVSNSIANKSQSTNGTTSKESNDSTGENPAVPNFNEPDKAIPKIVNEGGDLPAPDNAVLKDKILSIVDISLESKISTAGGDKTSMSEERGQPTSSSPQKIPSRSRKSSGYHGTSENFNNRSSLPHCKLAAATLSPITTSTKPHRPKTLWRMCMGVIFDELTILTGDVCFARTQGLHFFASVNVTDHDEAQEVTKVADGRNHFDFRMIRLIENQTIPGEIPDWQDDDTVYWTLEEMSNSSRTGIVPSFGYPPMVAALKLLPLGMCQKIYDELLNAYPAQTSTLPAFLIDTVVCATQADKPIDFPDGVGLVKPGLACPDSLGAPFVLSDGTVLGVLVAADCEFKNVAFFQTLGKGTPSLDEDEEEEIDH